MSSQGEWRKRRQAITLYVNNISETLHWKGLWQAFGRHGEVIDAFIASKKNREGRRFGFIRTVTRTDANRMIERLNNFHLFGSKITVSLSHFQPRQSYWRKVGIEPSIKPQASGSGTRRNSFTEFKERTNNPVTEKKEEVENKSEMGGGAGLNGDKRMRISGHVEAEALWKLNYSLIGEMSSVCSLEKVQNRLHDWGMGDIKVRRLGGKSFILTIEDLEFYKMLEDLHWSYLKEVFSSVRPWSETESFTQRATWIEISGVPLHCWNGTTFRRLAQLWGEFDAFGENLDCNVDCEKMTVLITTSRAQKICEVVDLEVGNVIFNIRIAEVGFIDSSPKNLETGKVRLAQKKGSPVSSSLSESLRSDGPTKEVT
ncbi:hypothetical protein V6N13_096810 [Hibiscus sabdariffa]